MLLLGVRPLANRVQRGGGALTPRHLSQDFEMLPVCDGSSEIFSRKPITQTFYMAGMLVGSFVFGWLSDRIGRKPTMMIALIILSIGGSFPFFLTPIPDLYYALVISRWPVVA